MIFTIKSSTNNFVNDLNINSNKETSIVNKFKKKFYKRIYKKIELALEQQKQDQLIIKIMIIQLILKIKKIKMSQNSNY